VNEAAKMSSAIHAGVDGIMTDLPDRLRATIEDKQHQA
jgi:glycerophosphoryl diester phosphodiesterase